ncbi:L,D-transpeptidase family protein [Neptuniibacter sp. QD48_11]|uniref:L,D-transpeptidase family protein n=1 Tax=unclassified Neptuniibacter TaxID=2630693 RepID=UPI0039F4B2F1
MLCIRVSIARQTLELSSGTKLLQSYAISTALNGPGEQKNSGCTPRGRHYIRAMIGSDAQENAVFVGRRQTGEIYSQELADAYPNRDWILTRIMWLSGLEIGRNRLGEVDTMQRYVYIHGTPDTEPMGVAKSHGCIRMRNSDLIQLFSKVSAGTSVLIEE